MEIIIDFFFLIRMIRIKWSREIDSAQHYLFCRLMQLKQCLHDLSL